MLFVRQARDHMWPVRDFDRVFFQPLALILTLACALLTFVGCGAVEEAQMPRRDGFSLPGDPLVVDTRGRFGGTLHYALPGEPTTFNFLAARESRSKLVTNLTTATLLDFDPVQQKVIAGICSGWTVSEDGRKVTLNLREGVRFSDGVPVTAADVLFTFVKIYEEGSRNVVRDSLLVSGRPLQVTSTDDFTVDLEFAETSAAAEYILTTVPVLPRHRFQEPGKKIEEYWNLETPPEEMAGLGPFVLQVRRPKARHLQRVDRLRRRPKSHAESAARSEVFGRGPCDCCRRVVHVWEDLRGGFSERCQGFSAGQWQTTAGDEHRRFYRGPRICRDLSGCRVHLDDRSRSSPSSFSGTGEEDRGVLEPGDSTGRDGGPWAFRTAGPPARRAIRVSF